MIDPTTRRFGSGSRAAWEKKIAERAAGKGSGGELSVAEKRVLVKRRRDEEGFQVSVVEWFSWASTGLLVFHVGNGGWRSKSEAARLKAMGVKAGVADLMVVGLGRVWFLELKSEDGRLDEKQVRFRKQVLDLGHSWALARRIEEVRDALDRWNKGEVGDLTVEWTG